MDRQLREGQGSVGGGGSIAGEQPDSRGAPRPGQRSLTQALSGSGSALPGDLRTRLESNLGEDLSPVRVHNDPVAATAARDLNARAFTVGQGIYFGAGAYDPHSPGGQKLVAHEVAHTVQQRGAAGAPQLESLDVSQPGDADEAEAESFADAFVAGGVAPAPPAARKMAPVSRGVVARAVIQRDQLPGGVPEPDSVPVPTRKPVDARHPSPGEMADGARKTIRDARGRGGTPAVVGQVKSMRAQASGDSSAAVETAVASELTPDERAALDGKPPASASPTGAPGPGNPAQPAAQPSAQEQPTTHPTPHPTAQPTPQPTAQPTPQPTAQPTPQPTAQPSATPATPSATAGASPAQAPGGPQHDGPHADPTPAPGPGGQHPPTPSPAPVPHPTPGPMPGPPSTQEPHPPAPNTPPPDAGGRALIESELAFHDNWKALAQAGPGGRFAHLMKGMLVGSDGSVMSGDLFQAGRGAANMSGMGLMMRVAATKTPLARIPGAGNIVGGVLSGYQLFSNGGAGIRSLTSGAVSGIGGAFSAQNWKESPWLTAANLVAGIKSALDLIGAVCNVLSGLAYAFAAIAAVGGLLSIFFPPLAFLVPYIPMAVNFGRACGGIATVCMTVSNLISPIPPILRAVHIIFSNQDPILLAHEEQTYHGEIQGAMANYASAAIDNKLAGGSGNPLAQFGGTIKDGAAQYRSAVGGGVLPTPKNVKAGVANTDRALGLPADPHAAGKSYFDPEGRTGPNQAQVDKDKQSLGDSEARRDQRQVAAGEANQRAADDASRRNRRAAGRANDKLDEANQRVDAREQALESSKQGLAVPSGAIKAPDDVHLGNRKVTLANPSGEVGNASENAFQQARANHNAATAQSAAEAYDGHGGAGPAPQIPRDKQGHVQLPDPPGSLAEIDQLDGRIDQLEGQLPQQRQVTTSATALGTQAGTQATGIDAAHATVTAHVQQNTARSAAGQARITAQTTDMQTRTTTAQGNASSGTGQAASPLAGIAGAARAVDGLLQRVPSNKFFDISGAQHGIHQFVQGMDMISGAPGGQQQSQQQTAGAVAARTTQTQQAGQVNGQASAQGNQLGQKMAADAAIARTAQAEAHQIAAQSKTGEQTIAQQIQAAKQQRAQKWQSLLAWAVQHRQLRATVLGPDNV